tara:strand:+ start:168944 stop:169441 length:498 start_codon:yes stop_codon:yes gene_type:complete
VKKLLFIAALSLSLFSINAFDVYHLQRTKDKNFNGIYRGMAVFQDILERDYNAANIKGLIRIKGEFTVEDLVTLLFKSLDVTASWDNESRPTVLDRGYINDGSVAPRVPEKLQKVIDLYNSQIMGLVRSSPQYDLIVYAAEGRQIQGWIIYNRESGEALYAAAYE